MEPQVMGLTELASNLSKLTYVVQAQGMRRAGKAGANVIKAAQKANAPVRTGRTRDDITIKEESTAYQIRELIGPGKKEAWYDRFDEFGVKPHELTARRSRVMVGRDGVIYGTHAQHPGFVGKPFIRPSLDEHQPEAVAACAAELWAVIGENSGGVTA